MARYTGGNEVKAGIYWNPRDWEMTVLQGKGGTLPGGPEARWMRVPLFAMLLLGPIMGAAFVIFLPFIGVAMLVYYGSRKAAEATGRFVRGAATAMSADWRPGEAYLAGKPRNGSGAKDEAAPESQETSDEEENELDSLEKEVAERRREE